MSAGFIPMVSTTPPPIDDDDFTDFMDSNHHGEFEDTSSPADEDDYSYPSINSPPRMSESLSFQEDDDDVTPQAKSPLEANDSVFANQKESHNEVEIILQDSEKSRAVKKSEGHVTSVKQVPSETVDNAIIEQTLPCDAGNVDKNEYDDNGFVTIHSSDNVKSSAILPSTNGVTNIERDENANNLPGDSGDESEDWMDFTESPEHHNDKTPNPGLPDAPDSSIRANASLNDSNETDDDESSIPEIQLSTKIETLEHEQKSYINAEENLPEFASVDCEDTKVSHDGSCDELGTRTATDSPPGEFVPKFSTDGTYINNRFDAFQSTTVDEEKSEPKDTSDNFDSENKSNHLRNHEIDDEDFGDFSSMRISEPGPKDVELQTVENGAVPGDPVVDSFDCDFGAFDAAPQDSGENDGFANFSAAPENAKTNSAGGWPDETEDPEFGAFSSQNDDFGAFASENNEDDFGDFGSSSTNAWAAAPEPVYKTVPVHEKIKNYVSSYSRRKEESESDDNISLLNDKLKTDVLLKDAETHSTLSVDSAGVVWPGDLWDQLEDIDNTIALSFVWNGSGHNKHLLDALGMHTQNILFSGSKQAYYVPTYYAAGLGMIDPTKGILKPMSAAEKITAISPSEKSAPATIDEVSSPTEPYPEWKSVADKHGSGSIVVVEGSGSWLAGGGTGHPGLPGTATYGGGSGGEPSRANDDAPVPINCSTMDLDYFDTLPTVQAGARQPGNSDLIDPELLELTTAPTTEPPPPPKDGGSATLSKILASIKSAGNTTSTSITTIGGGQDASKWEEEESKLSQEAKSVLQRLPDLSYMRSKVLMFPINMSRVNMAEDV